MNRSWWWLAAFIIVGILLGLGIIFLVTQPPRGEPIKLLPPPTQAPILVDVSGAVGKPGLYSLPYGSRVNDAIQAAGDFSENANNTAINLAKILVDGEQIIVPEKVKPLPTVSESNMAPISPSLVDINVATLEQLVALPEIGPITAQNIINYRNNNGLFSKIEDLLEVEEIGEKTFEKIKDLITIGTSP